jgi:hypothetical protein
MAAQPGLPGSQFQGQSEDYLVRRVQDLEKAVQQLAAANVFAPMGVTPTPDGFTVTGTETVTGALIVNGPETVNGALNVNGAMAVTGTLSLPAGIIGNDALTSPSTSVNFYANADSFTIPVTTETTIATATTTVPTGYTKVVIIATSTLFAYNSNTSTDYVTGRIYIDTPGGTPATGHGRAIPAFIGASGGSMNSTPTNMTSVTGLSGGATISVRLTVHTDNASITAASNGATIDVLAIFTR